MIRKMGLPQATLWCVLVGVGLLAAAGCHTTKRTPRPHTTVSPPPDRTGPTAVTPPVPPEPIPRPKKVTLRVSTASVAFAGGGTTVPQVGAYTYSVGDKIQVSARPDPGSIFDGWDVKGDVTMTTGNRSAENVAVISGDGEIYARFVRMPCTLAVAVAKIPMAGSGRTEPAVGEHACHVGDRVQVNAWPDPGSVFNGWESKGSVVLESGKEAANNTAVLNGDGKVYAKFILGVHVDPVCSYCTGKGRVPCTVCAGHGKVLGKDTCPGCAGTGKVRRLGWPVVCKACSGSGSVELEKVCTACRKGLVECPRCHGSGKSK